MQFGVVYDHPPHIFSFPVSDRSSLIWNKHMVHTVKEKTLLKKDLILRTSSMATTIDNHPLLARAAAADDCDYCFGDDGMIVPPDPFRSSCDLYREEQGQVAKDDDDYHDDAWTLAATNNASPRPCMEKLGLGMGILMGITVQLSTLAGDLVNVTLWGFREEGNMYVHASFIAWCCIMASLFFAVFAMLRFLIQMSFQMLVDKMERDDHNNQRTTATIQNHHPFVTFVADIPTDAPLFHPNPISMFAPPPAAPRIFGNGDNNNADDYSSDDQNSMPTKDQQHDELLEDIMVHVQRYYILGISFGISASWFVTNLLLGHERVPLVVSLVPPVLGFVYFYGMKLQQGRRQRPVPNNNTTSNHNNNRTRRNFLVGVEDDVGDEEQLSPRTLDVMP